MSSNVYFKRFSFHTPLKTRKNLVACQSLYNPSSAAQIFTGAYKSPFKTYMIDHKPFWPATNTSLFFSPCLLPLPLLPSNWALPPHTSALSSLFQATFGPAMRSKARLSSMRSSGPSDRENGGVGSPDLAVHKSMSTVPIARSSAVSLVWRESNSGKQRVPIDRYNWS